MIIQDHQCNKNPLYVFYIYISYRLHYKQNPGFTFLYPINKHLIYHLIYTIHDINKHFHIFYTLSIYYL
jgi:hypothetical protein